MALLGIAIAAGVVNINNTRRGPNCERQGCASTEDQWLSLRLTRVQLHTLALEYMDWIRQTTGVRMAYYTSERRVTVFLHYLARGGYYHQIGRAEGLALCTVMGHLHSVAAFFQQSADRFVGTCIQSIDLPL